MDNETRDRLFQLLSERVGALERVQRLQHDELGKVVLALNALNSLLEELRTQPTN